MAANYAKIERVCSLDAGSTCSNSLKFSQYCYGISVKKKKKIVSNNYFWNINFTIETVYVKSSFGHQINFTAIIWKQLTETEKTNGSWQDMVSLYIYNACSFRIKCQKMPKGCRRSRYAIFFAQKLVYWCFFFFREKKNKQTKNICCVISFKALLRGASNEYHYIYFLWRKKANIFLIPLLSRAMIFHYGESWMCLLLSTLRHIYAE